MNTFPTKRCHKSHNGGGGARGGALDGEGKEIKVTGHNSYSKTYHNKHYEEKGYTIIPPCVETSSHLNNPNFFMGRKEDTLEELNLETFVLIDRLTYFQPISFACLGFGG